MYISYVYMYICIYVYVCMCIYVCMHACMYVCTYVRIYVYMHVCMYVCTFVCLYIYMSICVYIYIYIYIYITCIGYSHFLHKLYDLLHSKNEFSKKCQYSGNEFSKTCPHSRNEFSTKYLHCFVVVNVPQVSAREGRTFKEGRMVRKEGCEGRKHVKEERM